MPRFMSPKEKKEEEKETKGMVDLKLPKSKVMETKEPAVTESERWPYNMVLRFESEQCDKLPQLKKMKIGQIANIKGIGEVTSISMHEEEKGKERYSVEIQLTKIGVN